MTGKRQTPTMPKAISALSKLGLSSAKISFLVSCPCWYIVVVMIMILCLLHSYSQIIASLMNNTIENTQVVIGVLILCIIYFRVLIGLFNHEITPLINWNTWEVLHYSFESQSKHERYKICLGFIHAHKILELIVSLTLNNHEIPHFVSYGTAIFYVSDEL